MMMFLNRQVEVVIRRGVWGESVGERVVGEGVRICGVWIQETKIQDVC